MKSTCVLFQISLTFDAGVVSASLDSSAPVQLTLDAVIDLKSFLAGSTAVVGAALNQGRDVYTTDGGGTTLDAVAIVPQEQRFDVGGPYFRGCLGEVMILHFFRILWNR